jgi:hypothetical protein
MDKLPRWLLFLLGALVGAELADIFDGADAVEAVPVAETVEVDVTTIT